MYMRWMKHPLNFYGNLHSQRSIHAQSLIFFEELFIQIASIWSLFRNRKNEDMADEQVFTVVATDEVIAAVQKLANSAGEDVLIGDPMPTTAISQAAEYPHIDPSLLEFLQQATIVIKAGTAGVLFITALRDLLAKKEGGKLIEDNTEKLEAEK